jgi:Asp-tRNA(Asn)/Glu-tRNA(Gln) amidotransferase B subunit
MKNEANRQRSKKVVLPIRNVLSRFTCKWCKHTLPMKFQMRTKDYCYMCDPNITLEELLTDKEIDEMNNPIRP